MNVFYWTLKSVDSKKFKLKVYFNNFVGNLNSDYIGIYDDEGKYQIAGLSYRQRNSEYIFYSDSNQILINCSFSIDKYYHYNYPSFYIEYEEINKPYIVEQTSTCNDFYYYQNTEHPYFEIWTPNYRKSSLPAYGNILNCSWSFNLSPGKRFEVNVIVYSIGKNDILSIYEGNSTKNSSPIKTFTKMFPPYANSNYYFISYKFYSYSDYHFI